MFDPEATLPALRSGGFSLFADGARARLLDTIRCRRPFNDASRTAAATTPGLRRGPGPRLPARRLGLARRSLALAAPARGADYAVGDVDYDTVEEGFVQLAVMQPAAGAKPRHDDLYLHEAIARWAGWSLSVPLPGKH